MQAEQVVRVGAEAEELVVDWVPTAAGLRLHERVAPLIRDIDEAAAEASAAAGQTGGALRINTLGMAATQIIAPRFGGSTARILTWRSTSWLTTP